MLNQRYRLKKNSAFTATYRVKKSFYLNGVAVFVGLTKKSSDDITKVGFVVSKKTHKRAVKRNRLKRLMREVYRLMLKSKTLGKSQDYMSLIFIAHERALTLNFKDMQLTMEGLLAKIND